MKNITVYSKPNCMQCEFSKKKLDGLGLSYETIDVTVTEGMVDFIKEKYNAQQLPLIVGVNSNGEETVIFGFKPDELEKLAQTA